MRHVFPSRNVVPSNWLSTCSYQASRHMTLICDWGLIGFKRFNSSITHFTFYTSISFYVYEGFFKKTSQKGMCLCIYIYIHTSVYKYRRVYEHAPLCCTFVLVCNYTCVLSYNNTTASSLTQSETWLGEILFQLFMFFAEFSVLSGCTELQRGTPPNRFCSCQVIWDAC